ncbi:MAG TPA: DCC1-like thiol-disulfide oxidoreductase family protein [Pyrinomonadaceae bacterium]|nr:DCC1-like thiol-disulfide oxidoreductase family protein [Pyrinomonadaceae bacterium]
MPEPRPNPIVLYDGVCGLCNRLNQFLLKRDHHDRLRFASLQSSLAESLTLRHGADSKDLDTVYVLVDHNRPTEHLLSRSDAIIYVLTQLGGAWKLMGAARIVPAALRNIAYNIVARNRYRVFGKHDSCMLPDPKNREKFLEV